MDKLIDQLKHDFPELRFIKGDRFCWQSRTQKIIYDIDSSRLANWALLHEVAHANLNHINFASDFGLLKQEVEAWSNAKTLANKYKINISDDYIEDCLDTYRDWLYSRSTCPLCLNACIQIDNEPVYLCHNCDHSWRVSRARLCRPYRQSASVQKPIRA